jgi:hypothetical protein
MTGTIGSGKLYFGSDFVGANGSAAVLDATVQAFGEGSESYAATTDEAGGIVAITTAGGDDDSAVLRAGPFSPRDGKMVLRTRFKYNNVDCAVFVGFTETLNVGTPVMPIELNGTTLAVNGSGGILGLAYDADATTDDFRAFMADGSAVISDTGAGIRAKATLTADRWFEAEFILNEDGSGECWFGHSGIANALLMNPLRLVKRFDAGTLLTNTDLFFPCLFMEERSSNARILEVDYFSGEAGRDWRF